MAKITEIMNFLEWQIKMRKPGEELFERAFQQGNDSDIEYYLYLCDIYNSKIAKYLFGSYLISKEKVNNFFDYLDYQYLDGDHYSFPIGDTYMNLPIPEDKDRKVFRTELFDLVLPYLAGYPGVSVPGHEGPYEHGSVALQKDDLVLDIGANFGMFAAYASAKGCLVHAFEPTFLTRKQYLEKTAKLNPNIIIHPEAVSDVTGYGEFLVDNNNFCCNGLVDTKNNVLNHDTRLMTVQTISIDDFIQFEELRGIDFIKADIEGAERLMLKGAKYALKYFSPKLAICYYHLLDDEKVLSNLITGANKEYTLAKKWRKIYANKK